MAPLRRIAADDLPRLRLFWQQHWGGEEMIVHGQVFRPERLEGFVNADWTGLVTFLVTGDGCEIISLDSLKEGGGTGTSLVQAVVDEAGRRGCGRVLVTTTNDNLHALGFYQRRGFELAVIRRGAVAESRRLKPAIPLVGDNNIPIRDEIELELRLPAQNAFGHGS